jgi:hypothetical protein
MDQIKHVVDGASIATAALAVIGWLPAAAALASIVWTLIRIYETKTVQELLRGKND